jgi:deoxycytidine triphosphate deaminase
MLLGTESIIRALQTGAIVCNPTPSRIEGTHIDITLGEHAWWFTSDNRNLYLRDADPGNFYQHVLASNGLVCLPAYSLSLCHTREYIGTAPGSGLVPNLHTRSTIARWGLSVCTANAGQGDIGYCSRWTLEIINPHPNDIYVPVGARIGSITFSRVDGHAVDYDLGERYNATIQEWQPSNMLPRKGNL